MGGWAIDVRVSYGEFKFIAAEQPAIGEEKRRKKTFIQDRYTFSYKKFMKRACVWRFMEM